MVYHCMGKGCKWFAKLNNRTEAQKRHDYHVLQCHPESEHGKVGMEAVHPEAHRETGK